MHPVRAWSDCCRVGLIMQGGRFDMARVPAAVWYSANATVRLQGGYTCNQDRVRLDKASVLSQGVAHA
ncbi:hypothetical protein IG631_10614 [Alternaria alternata]|nr:hypothetical protein IG631_10614 [Alternaria alternata]